MFKQAFGWLFSATNVNAVTVLTLGLFSVIVTLDSVLPSMVTLFFDELLYGMLIGWLLWVMRQQRKALKGG